MNEKEKDALIQVKHFNNITRYWQEEEYEEKEIAGYIETILNLIEKQSKEIEELKEKNKYLPNWVSKKYVSKDKIKAKIEELDKQEEDLQNSISDEEREEYSDANISWKLMDIQIRREVLQSLLEKE